MLTRIQSLLAIVTVLAAGFAGYMNQSATRVVDGAVNKHNVAEVVHVQATGKHNDRADSHYARSSNVNNKLNAQAQAIVKIEGSVKSLAASVADQKEDMRELKIGQKEILTYIRDK